MAPTLSPGAIIASFVNPSKTLAFQVTASGTLVQMHRSHPSDIWSPPGVMAEFTGGIDEIQALLVPKAGA